MAHMTPPSPQLWRPGWFAEKNLFEELRPKVRHLFPERGEAFPADDLFSGRAFLYTAAARARVLLHVFEVR